ncbi:MAG: hypothetical protein MUE60_13420 [Candidatus Eisenbacteria bacterium]|nr:hypothetical protein [Candidatus Eisenbacteria bacterium]
MFCHACICVLLLGSAVSGQGGFGAGIILGEPTGVSLKAWLDDRTALDGAAAWSFSGHDSFQLHADWLIHYFDVMEADDLRGALPVYVGIGGRIRLREEHRGDDDEDVTLGVRLPFGMTYIPDSAPVDVFVEFVPTLDVVPGTDFDLAAGFGARFFFR